MPSSTPHQNYPFYHLLTRGRVGIKLGDAWYVSNVSITFDCSMLYYLLFWTLLAFIIHFYIIVGTNLLTGGLAQNCFFPILGFRRKGIPNGVQTEWNLREHDFITEHDPGDLDPTSRNKGGGHGVGGAPTPKARPPPSWAPWCSPGGGLPPLYTYVPPNDHIRSQNPNSTAATFCIHEIPSWGLFRSYAGGGIDHGGLLHQHLCPSDEVWVVYLRPSGP